MPAGDLRCTEAWVWTQIKAEARRDTELEPALASYSTRRYSRTRRWSDRCRFTWETSSAPPPSSPRSSTTPSSTPSPQTPPYALPPSPISAPPTNATPPASRFLTACSITKASWPVRRTSCGSRTAGRWRLRCTRGSRMCSRWTFTRR